jgi:hypothetical protein
MFSMPRQMLNLTCQDGAIAELGPQGDQQACDFAVGGGRRQTRQAIRGEGCQLCDEQHPDLFVLGEPAGLVQGS